LLTNVSDPETYPKISVSELQTLLRCTKKHDYAYRQGLSPVESPSFISKGSYLHKLMERRLKAAVAGEDFDLNAVSVQLQAELLKEKGTTVTEPDRAEANLLFQEWLDKVEKHDIDLAEYVFRNPEDGTPLIEAEFMVDLGWRDLDDTPVLLHGFIDLVGQDHEGALWPNEHKTAARAWSVPMLQFHYQAPLYVAALRTLFPDLVTRGVQYNFFLPKGVDIKQVYLMDAHVESVLAEAQAGIYLRDTGSIVRQPHWGCNDCWYRNLCVAELMGLDAEHVRETQFNVDEAKASRFVGEE